MKKGFLFTCGTKVAAIGLAAAAAAGIMELGSEICKDKTVEELEEIDDFEGEEES